MARTRGREDSGGGEGEKGRKNGGRGRLCGMEREEKRQGYTERKDENTEQQRTGGREDWEVDEKKDDKWRGRETVDVGKSGA